MTQTRTRLGRLSVRSRIVNGGNGGHLASLVRAEAKRLTSTRLAVTLLAVGAATVLAMGVIRTLTMQDVDTAALSIGIGTSGVDIFAFVVTLTGALYVARDHQSTAMELRHLIEPRRGRMLIAVTAAFTSVSLLVAIIAMLVVSCVAAPVLGTTAPLVGESVTGMIRASAVVACSAILGVGTGFAVRSTAGGALVVTALFWLAPVGLLIGGLSGAAWAASAAEFTVGILVGRVIDASESAQLFALAMLAAWAMISLIVGLLRERKR